jgi:hypothetical protein
MTQLRFILACLAMLLTGAVLAQEQPKAADDQIVSKCVAIAQGFPGATYANFDPGLRPPYLPVGGANEGVVEITYAGHSTYLIETPAGVRIATDFSGVYGSEFNPRVVTMNKAHRTHYTLTPPVGIEYVLHGWGENGQPAKHGLVVEDVTIRNVTTDIRSWGGELERDGNSIFIFEVAGLCIGHLGHLHTKLSDKQFGQIGRLDILMVPIDGGLTQNIESITEITQRLYSSMILPMHRHSMSIGEFTRLMGDGFAVDFRAGRSLTVSLGTLPNRPTIVVLDGV